ncbi:hypothetical protein PGT21_007471 [Puccinia graminis f. sp. tritici]|uniref:Uncharacterized protein n=1 Tax=Puccinia graminis f. sp. tritici TaxID=56615 RepID=A0A5B0MLJ4_PUCGR|nr:hypothetical protein PGTUg99_006214 [Puccinia graminis f. sp. tritici]KAA1104019.1 hypothetical protein PGT21_007471 [Puccinia graminis f. sp. tritici]
MADPTQEIFAFVLSLPQSINPYEAVASKIKELIQVPRPPLWGRILRRVIAFQFCVYNQLGLIHVEVLNEIVLFMLIFSTLAVIDLVTQELVELDLIKFSSKLVVRISKFAIPTDVCWCQCFDLPCFTLETNLGTFAWWCLLFS